LNTLGTAERRGWAKKVLEQLLPHTRGYQQIVFFAGSRYREFLVEPLKSAGLEIVIPMEGLSFGKQLAWLAQHT